MPDTAAIADLDAMSKSDLKTLQRKVQVALSKSEARRKKEALKAVEQVVKEFDFSLQELLTFAGGRRRKLALASGTSANAKYRNPEKPEETWSGRGRRPIWFKAQLEAGRNEDDLRA